jgi:hypothetical protein
MEIGEREQLANRSLRTIVAETILNLPGYLSEASLAASASALAASAASVATSAASLISDSVRSHDATMLELANTEVPTMVLAYADMSELKAGRT